MPLALTKLQQEVLPKVNRVAHNILMGAYPGAKSDDVTKQMQQVLCQQLKITHFISLMEPAELRILGSCLEKLPMPKNSTLLYFARNGNSTSANISPMFKNTR